MLVVAGTLFGWFLVIWVAVLGRPLGALALPAPVALAIGLPLGILLPLAYARMQMVTEVYPDSVKLHNGPSGTLTFPLAEIDEVTVRKDRIRDDYDHRRIASAEHTHIAYTVASDEGVQLTLADGRRILIGSKEPDELGAAVTVAWRAARAGERLPVDG